MNAMENRAVILGTRAVTVDYPGVRALDAVTLDFRAGEIHAIVGENGAGKSTLMKVISGAMRPTEGELELAGHSANFAQPSEAIAAGIAMVHQELNLVPTLTVEENIALGREPTGVLGIAVDHRAQRAQARELLALLGSACETGELVSSLSIGQAQCVEIAKCLARDARVLIFDEPTAVLGEQEAARLFVQLRRLRDEGRAVIFISHHLDEVVTIADRVSVLRDGQLVESFARDQSGSLRDARGRSVDAGRLAAAMVGRELGSLFPNKGAAIGGQPAIELIDFGARGISQGISLSVSSGEIVGIAGLVGSGRSETAQAIVGLRPQAGRILLAGSAVRFESAGAAMRAGLAYVSEDRKGSGLHLSLSSIANVTLPSLDAYTSRGGLHVDSNAERATTNRWIDTLGIRCARPDSPIALLSGGNQQKIALARWLETNPKVLIIDEPTRGVDVGAKAEIYQIIAQLARDGLACIVISSDLPELIGLAHRVVVMRGGRVVGGASREQLALRNCEERIMRIASGLSAELEACA